MIATTGGGRSERNSGTNEAPWPTLSMRSRSTMLIGFGVRRSLPANSRASAQDRAVETVWPADSRVALNTLRTPRSSSTTRICIWFPIWPFRSVQANAVCGAWPATGTRFSPP